MEECDALCTRIVIMVNGKFVCLGSPQHLKNNFGQGYTLIVRLNMIREDKDTPTEPLVHFVQSHFPRAEVFDGHQGYVHFQIADGHVSLARVFSIMEHAKRQFDIEDYSVHQTTLEQVFLNFTRNQVAPKEDVKVSCKSLCCCMSCC
jgi:ATP-binding cassette subfamily A (ABC1) protein 3